MKRRSLRLRLLAAAALSICLALLVAGGGLAFLFERHVERRVLDELDDHIGQIAGALMFVDGAPARLSRPLADPRFGLPFSGLYWWVTADDQAGAGGDGGEVVASSRSLWDFDLASPPTQGALGATRVYEADGPLDSRLIVRERLIEFPAQSGPTRLRVAVAVDRAEIDGAVREYAAELAPSLGVLALALMAGAWIQVGVGLRPLEAVRRGVRAIRADAATRLGDDFPQEVKPLIAEVNALLDGREKAVAEAETRAADLAHGLKTPLTVIAADAERLRVRGETALADELGEMADSMRRRVERELARARLWSRAAGSRRAAAVAPVVRRVIATLERAHDAGALAWRVDIDEVLAAAVDEDDLTELLGVALDNAAKWARSTIAVAATTADRRTRIVIDDDGPGAPADKLALLDRRGLRLDEQVEGAGIGLAIAADIVEAYGGNQSFAASPLGGLRVTVTLPA